MFSIVGLTLKKSQTADFICLWGAEEATLVMLMPDEVEDVCCRTLLRCALAAPLIEEMEVEVDGGPFWRENMGAVGGGVLVNCIGGGPIGSSTTSTSAAFRDRVKMSVCCMPAGAGVMSVMTASSSESS